MYPIDWNDENIANGAFATASPSDKWEIVEKRIWPIDFKVCNKLGWNSSFLPEFCFLFGKYMRALHFFPEFLSNTYYYSNFLNEKYSHICVWWNSIIISIFMNIGLSQKNTHMYNSHENKSEKNICFRNNGILLMHQYETMLYFGCWKQAPELIVHFVD